MGHKKVCLNTLKKAMKKAKFMNDRNAKEFMKELEDLTAKKQETNNMNRAEAMNMSVEEMIDREQIEARKRARRTYLNIQAQVRNTEFAKAFDNKIEALNARLTGSLRYKPGGRESMHIAMINAREELAGDFHRAMVEADLFQDFIKDRTLQRLIAQEFFDPKSTGNDKAFKIAELMKATYGKGRRLLNKWGADIENLESFVANQTHDVMEMRSSTGSLLKDGALYVRLNFERGFAAATTEMKRLAFVRWRNFIIDKLDKQKTFREVISKDIEGFLQNAYDALISGQHNTPSSEESDSLEAFKAIRPASRAERLSAHRILHFKDGESWDTYNEEYGSGSLPSAFYQTVEKMGKNIGIMKFFGPSSKQVFDNIIKKLKEDPKERTKILTPGRINKAKRMFDFAAGITNIPSNVVLANWAAGFRSYVTLVRLPLVLLASFQDVANRASAFRDHGIGFFDRWSALLGTATNGMTREEKLALSNLFRVTNTMQLGIYTSRMSAFDSPSGAMSKAMQMFFKYNGMNWWDRVNRQSHAVTLGAHLGSFKDVEFKDINPLEKRMLTDYKIGKEEWDFYRKNAQVVVGTDETTFIAPDAVREATDEGVSKYLTDIGITRKDITPTAIQNAQDELSDKLGAYFIDRTDHAILRPDLADSTIIVRGGQRGTIYGELGRSLAHFKTFSVSFARKVLGRKIYGGNINGNPDIMGLIEIMATSTILGGAIIEMKLIGQGKISQSFGEDFFLAAMLQGGGLGIYGDFLFGEYNRYGQTPVGNFIGPDLGTINDMTTFLYKLAKMDHPAEATAQFFGRNTPFINMWFLKTALNYLFLYSLAEHLSPGYLARMQRNLIKQRQQQFLFPPTQHALRPFG